MEKTNLAATTSATECCSGCRYCRMHLDGENLQSVCRRYPPLPIGGPVVTPKGVTIVSQGVSPSISSPDTEWCGEFSPRLAS